MSQSRGRDQGRRNNRRSRSQSRGRDTSDQRWASDPKTQNARIFVGSIPDDMSKEALEEHFSKFGTLVGVLITNKTPKFGFVQFSTEDEARASLSAGSSIFIGDVRVDVKPAKMGGGRQNDNHDSRGRGRGDGFEGGRGRGRSPNRQGDRRGRGEGGGAHWMSQDRDRSPIDSNRGESDYFGNNVRDGGRERVSRFDAPFDEYYQDHNDRYADYYREPLREMDDRFHDNPGYPPAPEPYLTAVPEILDPLDPNRNNDVEIVVPHKMQRPYAESIEARLKQAGLIVDLLFPPPDIPPMQVLNDLAQRHCLYAIFITGDNEAHRSLTLNVLHGTAQEHRNMPVEDALHFIEVNFGEYVKKVRQRGVLEIIPKDIHNLICDLLENRSLTIEDFDKVIQFLKERKSYLVGDLESKSEKAPEANSSRPMAVTYPGYNYDAKNMDRGHPVIQSLGNTNVGAVTLGAAMTGIAAAVPHASPVLASLPHSYSNYGGVPTNTGSYGAYSMQHGPPQAQHGSQHVSQQSQHAQTQMQQQHLHPPPQSQAHHYGQSPAATNMPPMTQKSDENNASKLSELQARILNLTKVLPTGVPAPQSMPIPTGVPAPPTGVPAPSMMHTSWQGSNQLNNSTNKAATHSSHDPNAYASYSPWSQVQ